VFIRVTFYSVFTRVTFYSVFIRVTFYSNHIRNCTHNIKLRTFDSLTLKHVFMDLQKLTSFNK